MDLEVDSRGQFRDKKHMMSTIARKSKFNMFTVCVEYIHVLPLTHIKSTLSIPTNNHQLLYISLAQPIETEPNAYVINDISTFTKNDDNHSTETNANNDENDRVTAIVRGTTHIWKPYSASYIGSLYI